MWVILFSSSLETVVLSVLIWHNLIKVIQTAERKASAKQFNKTSDRSLITRSFQVILGETEVQTGWQWFSGSCPVLTVLAQLSKWLGNLCLAETECYTFCTGLAWGSGLYVLEHNCPWGRTPKTHRAPPYKTEKDAPPPPAISFPSAGNISTAPAFVGQDMIVSSRKLPSWMCESAEAAVRCVCVCVWVTQLCSTLSDPRGL